MLLKAFLRRVGRIRYTGRSRDANRLARLRELYLGNNRAARGTAHRLAGCMRALAPDSVQFSGLRTIGALSLAGNRISDAGGA